MSNSIGQYRFQGTGSCVTAVDSSKQYVSTATVGTGEGTSTSFQDIMIVSSAALQQNQDYYLYVKVPQDLNYDMTFNIKLTRSDTTGSDASEVYQFLASVTIPKGGSGNNVYTVALYDTGQDDGEGNDIVSAMIPLQYSAGSANTQGLLYYDAATGKYYVGNGGTSYTETIRYNDVSLGASWLHEVGSNYGYAELVFRPVESGFSRIVLEMVRTAEDYNIQGVADSGETIYGRYIPLDSFEYTLYTLTNLVNDITPNGSLDRVGVWSHPGLLMAVNGEEIRVGKSGLWEIDGILPIESLGIVAVDYKDNFSIDFMYEN